MNARKKVRVVVLISGRGSNMRALVEAARYPGYPAEIVAVLSNRRNAPGLNFAQSQNITAEFIDHKRFSNRVDFDLALDLAIRKFEPDLVCLAGFMRLLTSDFVDGWSDRMINIHPSLLPSFKGLNTHRRAIETGVKVTGCTVHFVRPDMDSGPIIAQAAVPVLANDTEEMLAERVLEAEHRLYPHALKLVASGQARVRDERVLCEGETDVAATLFSPPLERN